MSKKGRQLTSKGYSGTYKTPDALPKPTVCTTSDLDAWLVYGLREDYYAVESVNIIADGEMSAYAPIYWTGKTGKESLSLTADSEVGDLSGVSLVCSGGKYTDGKGFTKGKATYDFDDVWIDDSSIEATAGATVNLDDCSVSESTLTVSNGGTISRTYLFEGNNLVFSGGTIKTFIDVGLPSLTLNIASNTAQNLYVGDIVLSDDTSVTVNYSGKYTKPMLAVQGLLTLDGTVNISFDTSGTTKYMAPHDFVLFQSLGLAGDVSSLNVADNPGWRGRFVSTVVNGSYIIAYVQNTAQTKYTKPKALSGNTIRFMDERTLYTDADWRVGEQEEYSSLTFASTKGSGSFAVGASYASLDSWSSLSADTVTFSGGWDAKKGIAKAGKATYNVFDDLCANRIEAVQGATVHLTRGCSGKDNGWVLAVNAGSTKTTLLDVVSEHWRDEYDAYDVTLDYAGGTIRGNISATGMTATFDKTVKQQNILDGNLTLSGNVVVDAVGKITRPVLAVTGTLTLGDVKVDITGDAKQSDFVLFQSREQSITGTVTVTFNNRTMRMRTVTAGEYDLYAYVSGSTAPKAVKLAACSVEPYSELDAASVDAEQIAVYGEAGGELLETHDLDGGSFDAVLVQSGIAELAEGEVLTAPVISVGTGADEFNATLNNSGTLQGAVEITKNASIDNQGTITGPVAVGGTLNNDGCIEGSVTVDAGAILRGSGSISALTLADGAILSSTGDTMTVGSLTLGGETVVSLYLEGVSGAVSRELLKADSVSGEGTWSLTLSGVSMEDAELVWEDGVLTLKGTAAEQQALVAAPATAPDTRVPQLLANSLWAVTETTKSFVNNALRQYRDRTAGKTTAYASALGSFVNMSGFTANGGGGAVGVEHNVAEGAALGLSLGYTDSKLKGDGAAIDQDSTHATVYTDIRRGAWGLQAYAAYGDTENKLRGSRAKFDTDDYAAGATTSWSIGCVSLFSGLRYATARADVADGRMQVWQLPVGATVSKQYGKLITSATAAYVGDLARQNPRVKAAGESIRGANPGRSGFELNLGATYLISESWSASANYALETRSRATSQSVNASVRYSF